ncbi:MAG: lysine--tRNA ligase [Fimbriiglobus sp.]|nr:lysine--tRNA ligase [Fimbriiglobus sp.]
MSADPTPPADQSDQAAVRFAKLQQIEALGVDPWGQRFDGHTPVAAVRELPCETFDSGTTGPTVRIAGRVVGKRDKGKIFFLDVWDQTGKIQVMLGAKQIGDLGWKLLNLTDLGDLIGIEGEFGKTKLGEPTVRAATFTYLTKSLEPHPTNYYGLADEETRLRKRYLDLIYTSDTLRRAHQRVKILRTIRNHLDSQGFLEVETPVLQAVASGAAARPFDTHHNALDIPLVLRIALELPLKRLLVGGIEKVYEIGRVFRNEGISHKHNPEFTMLELYSAYGDLFSIMDLTENLLVACVDAIGPSSFVERTEKYKNDKGEEQERTIRTPSFEVLGPRTIPWGDKQVNFTPPFQRAKYGDLFCQHVGCDMQDRAAVKAKASEFKVPDKLHDEKTKTSVEKEHDVLVNDLFSEVVEPHLVGPVFVYDYPAAICPLTKRKPSEPHIAERFELYVHGMELANAYTELNDPITQEATFRKQLAGQSEEDSMAKLDDDFIRALRHGMPPAGGLGIGIDRLVMLLTNTPTIRDVILFPLLRPEGK